MPDLVVNRVEPEKGIDRYYTKIHGRPPAQTDMQRYFKVTPSTVHQMVLKLDQLGLLEPPGLHPSLQRAQRSIAELARIFLRIPSNR